MRILKVIGLLLEYPDELLWENRDDALALIRADVPSLTPFVGELLTAPLLGSPGRMVRGVRARARHLAAAV
ncbi:respiratory nitrate reductase subunit delta [Klebsiella pneumoniae]|nr:respiratory nitrate reductase subunit delta [Klebsiella pneumoniae]